MDISLRNISMHYIRIHFGYAPGTHILNALWKREERIYLSCPIKNCKIISDPYSRYERAGHRDIQDY